jgi:hypothetical protein
MEEIRNIVNYREVGFLDPQCLDFWDKFDTAIIDESIFDLINSIINDSLYVYCFQREYGVVAIPSQRPSLRKRIVPSPFSFLFTLTKSPFIKGQLGQ